MRNILLLTFILVSTFMQAQDRHYWFQQFGGRSSMLGGAVVGDVRDNSSTFYNPAALGFIENNMLSISANAYNLGYFRMENALGEGVDVHKYPFLIYPQMIGGFVPFAKNQKWKWGYSLITRNTSSFTIFSRYADTRDAIKHIKGDEKFVAGYEIQSQKQEQWGGITTGRKINEHWSFGTTMNIAYKTIHGSERVFYKAFPQTDTPEDIDGNPTDFYIAKLGEDRFYDIPIVNIIWKVGLAAEYGDWRFGFTSTLPAINLGFMNFGESQREFEVSNISLNINGTDYFITDYLEIGRQKDNLTGAKTPLSFATGISKKFSKGKILFSTEYFFPVETHNLVNANNSEFESTPGFTLEREPNLNVSEAYKAVLNVSIALEYKVMENWNLLTSVRTDFNNHEDVVYSDEPPIEPYHSPWDLYHFTIGAEHVGNKSNLTAGLQYSLGTGTAEQYQNFTDPNNSTLAGILNPTLGDMTYLYQGFNIIISYTYKFKDPK
jgi:hypothetical protein